MVIKQPREQCLTLSKCLLVVIHDLKEILERIHGEDIYYSWSPLSHTCDSAYHEVQGFILTSGTSPSPSAAYITGNSAAPPLHSYK